MNKLYTLTCENWTGTSYDKELVEIYKDEELAQRTALVSQGAIRKDSPPVWDVGYYVEAVDYDDLELKE